MISTEILRQVLADNRILVSQKKIFPRDIKMGEFPRCVLVGVRRSGKSYLLFDKIQKLLASGRSWDSILYINFEDERLMGFDAADFNKLLEVQAELSGKDALPALLRFSSLTAGRSLRAAWPTHRPKSTSPDPTQRCRAFRLLQRWAAGSSPSTFSR